MAAESGGYTPPYLEGELPEVEATIQYTSRNDLARTLRDFRVNSLRKDNCDHTILVKGYPSENFAINEEEDGIPLIPKSSKILYLNEARLLFVTMPSGGHEMFTSTFTAQFNFKLRDMNCFGELRSGGAPDEELQKRRKAPDGLWGLWNDTTTFALETAVSEGDGALAIDARIWLENAASTVTQVVTAKVRKSRPEIILSVWKQTTLARVTRFQHPRRGYIDHEVCVTLENRRPRADGDIRLSFESLFMRKPRPGTAEGDLVFSASDIEEIARFTWEKMKFIRV